MKHSSSVRLLFAGNAILIALWLSPAPVHAQDCFDAAANVKLVRMQQQLGRTANPQSGLEYQLAQAQVDLESARAREFTSKSTESTIARQKAESKVKGLDDTVKRLDTEIKRLAALPNCEPGRTTPPGTPRGTPPGRRKGGPDTPVNPQDRSLGQGGG